MKQHPPLLTPYAQGWKYDLPRPNDPINLTIDPRAVKHSPNFITDITMELPRSTSRLRGVGLCVAVVLTISAIGAFCYWITLALLSPYALDLLTSAIGLSAIALSLWLSCYCFRMDTEAPRDEAIRFNRARKKIYVYRFHSSMLKPFSRKAWGVRPVVYDWDSLHAEFCSTYGPMGNGGLIEIVTLAILEPGTRQVLDRFLFANDGHQGEVNWAMARLFMHHGPQALPSLHQAPRDWNDESIFNTARRLGPRVTWPLEMDLESRTAPEDFTD